MKEILFWVRAIAQIGEDQYPGQPGKGLQMEHVRLGPLICYESIFGYLSRLSAKTAPTC